MSNIIHTPSKMRRKRKIRRQITGGSSRPRLSINISGRHVSAQIIDDGKKPSKTLCYSTSLNQKNLHNLSDKAAWVGEDIAKKAKAAKIKQVVFDRGAKLYHGRVKKLADTARKHGLEF